MRPEKRDRIIVGTVTCGCAFVFIVVLVILAWRFGCYAVVCCRCCSDGSVYKTGEEQQPSTRPTRSFGANILDGEDLGNKEEAGVDVRVESSTVTSGNNSFHRDDLAQVV